MINLLTKGKVPSLVLFIFLLALTPLKSLAVEFTVDNLTYTTSGTTASVKAAVKTITGEVIVPETVTNNGTTYTVTTVPTSAFSGCTVLTAITFPKTVTSISDNSFYNTPALSAINVDSQNTAYCSEGGVLYDKNKTLIIRYPQAKEDATYNIPSTVKTLGASAFRACKNLNSISIPESVTTMGDYCFHGCTGLTSIVLPNNITELKMLVLGECSSLTSITLPVSLTDIGTSAFSGCINLLSITIPESVTSIGSGAFNNCRALTSLTIPRKVNSIGNPAFLNTLSLTEFKVDSESKYFTSESGVLFNKAKTYLIAYPAGKTESSYSIPSTVTTVLTRAFSGASNLQSVEIGAKVREISTRSFENCSNLVQVKCLTSTPPTIKTGTDASFLNTPADKTLVVPNGALDAYKASNWNTTFNNIEEVSPLTINIVGEGKVYNDNVAVASGTVIEEGSVNLLILPDDGYYIESATLAGVDVKGRIVNHFLTIEDCSAAGVLEVFFAENEVAGEPEEASLTVNGGDTHSLAHYYTEGTQAKINLKPNTGWELYSLAYNGDDVTNEVDNNTYTTPELYGHDNNLDIVMKKSQTTGANAAYAQRRISFRSFGEVVEIFNLEDGENISIYDLEGNCKYQGSNHTVTLTPGNVYILNTNNETLKFSH